jgi:hypothetical protein
MNISKWKGYFREALSPKEVKAQFKPGSVLSKLFMFAFVGAIAIGVIYSFVMNNLVGTRASSELISATTAASKQNVALNEEFTVNVLFASTGGKKVSQLDLRMKFPTGGTNGDVTYTPGGYESAAVGTTATNYFDTLVLEEVTGTGADKMLRLVLSARKPEAELSDKVLVKVKFKGTANGKVKFTLDSPNMEIVGPGGGGAEPISYSIGVGSVDNTEVTIGTVSDTPIVQPSNTPVPPSTTTAPTSTAPGQPSATPAPTNTTAPTAKPSPTQTTDTKPTPTITIAPAPVCVVQ